MFKLFVYFGNLTKENLDSYTLKNVCTRKSETEDATTDSKFF